MIYLISYDIRSRTKEDEEPVLDVLRRMKAVQCLFSEWLIEAGPNKEDDISKPILAVMSNDDSLLVIPVGTPAVYHNLRNEKASLALLSKGTLTG